MLSVSSFKKLVSNDIFEIKFYKNDKRLLKALCVAKKDAPKSEEGLINLWDTLNECWIEVKIENIRLLRLPRVSFSYYELYDLAVKLGEVPTVKDSERLKRAIAKSKNDYGRDI